MLKLENVQKVLGQHKSDLFSRYHLTEIGIFGSMSRGDNLPNSDIDILIDYSGTMGLEFVDLAEELEQLLHAKVDLVSKRAIRPKLFARIKQDIVYV